MFQTHLRNVQDQLCPPEPYSTKFHYISSLICIPISSLHLLQLLFRSILLLSAIVLSYFFPICDSELQYQPLVCSFEFPQDGMHISPHTQPATHSNLSEEVSDSHWHYFRFLCSSRASLWLNTNLNLCTNHYHPDIYTTQCWSTECLSCS